MLYHLSLDTNTLNPKLFDSRTNTIQKVQFNGARSFLQEYINNNHLKPVSIYESHLPDRTQLICWYEPPILWDEK